MFSDPSKNVAAMGVREGMHVADFGAGSGAYTVELARRAGHTGRVYAVDVQKELLTRVEKLARDAGVRNVHIVWGNVEKQGGSTLKDGSVDLVLVANVLFLSDAKFTLMLEAKRILHAGGRVAVVEWTDSFGGLGPAPSRVVSVDEVKKIAAEAGLEYTGSFAAGDHHYGLLFTKPVVKSG